MYKCGLTILARNSNFKIPFFRIKNFYFDILSFLSVSNVVYYPKNIFLSETMVILSRSLNLKVSGKSKWVSIIRVRELSRRELSQTARNPFIFLVF